MGLCCCGNRPPKEFVGVWSNGDTVRLRIWDRGNINYFKEGPYGNTRWNTPACYDDKGFCTCVCCCCFLKGVYDDRRRNGPAFIVNNDVLTKQPASIREMPAAFITTTN